MVADNDSGKSIESEVRTSSGMFLSKAQVSDISNRFLLIPKNISNEFNLNVIASIACIIILYVVPYYGFVISKCVFPLYNDVYLLGFI